jgi:chorismate synthase
MKYTIFGESHGPCVGVVLEGVPAGLELDMEFIRSMLSRRAPGRDPTATARREADEPRILSGVMDGSDHRRAAVRGD